ncbi:MAG: ClbS/DfsB family four-helix bundle protein [Chloroflexi bacterium]|nr:ClbS/DfsB family four-helix bundle protein [Chloroflexota bacterium]
MAELSRKQALLEQLISTRAEWDELVTQLINKQQTSVPLTGIWTLKDIVAHLSFWETRAVKWFEAAARGTEPEPSPVRRDWSEEQINEWIYEQNQARSLEEVLAASRQIHEAVVNAVRAMPEEELAGREISWLGNASLAESVPGNSYEHYRDHIIMIRAALEATLAR